MSLSTVSSADHVIPPELLRPVPRRVKSKEPLGCLAMIMLAFTLWEGFLVYCWVQTVAYAPRDPAMIGLMTMFAGYLGYVWWVIFNGVAVRTWVNWRLCRWGKPVIGRVLQRREKRRPARKKRYRWSYFVDYQFDHPGLGAR